MSVATQFAKKGDITEGVVTDVDTSFANLDDKREVKYKIKSAFLVHYECRIVSKNLLKRHFCAT